MTNYTKIICLKILFASSLISQPNNIWFETQDINSGLSNNNINCILQDRQGFMWIGTDNGLNKYDGYDFTSFNTVPGDSNSISDNFITALCEDDYGNLWIGTSNGLNRFHLKSEKFHSYVNDPNSSFSLPDNSVTELIIDEDGDLWIGTAGGIARLPGSVIKSIKESDPQFIIFLHNPNDSKSISSNNIKCIIDSRDGDIWISTWCDGVNIFNKHKNEFTRYASNPYEGGKKNNDGPDICVTTVYQDPEDNNIIWFGYDELGKFELKQGTFTEYYIKINNQRSTSFIKATITSIYKTSKNILIAGTAGAGLLIFDENEEKFYQLAKELSNPNSISSNNITTIYEDNSGVVWIGTTGGGVFIFDMKRKNFYQHMSNCENKNLLNSFSVKSIFEDHADGSLWLGTENEGLIRYDPEICNYKQFKFDNIKNSFRTPNSYLPVVSINQIPDQKEIIWLGLKGQGLVMYNKNQNEFSSKYYISPGKEFWKPGGYSVSVYSTMHLTDITLDKKNNLWLASILGLYEYNMEIDSFRAYKHDPDAVNCISNNKLECIIYNDQKNELLIGTKGTGLDIYNPETGQFINYRHDASNHNSISNNFIRCLCLDKNGILWIGTSMGLNRFNSTKKTFTKFFMEDGLPSNNIQGILEDDNGNFWISTDKGISHFISTDKIFRNYDVYDGLQGNEFNSNACFKNHKGELFFGGSSGLNSFHPDSIKDNSNIPNVVLTEFQLFNKTVKPGNNSPLKISISKTKKIILNYDQSVFSFKFAALDYSSPLKNKYAYKMEGIDKDWVYTDATQRFATYTNLDPGKYAFSVKGSNNDGVWNENPASISIIILPPWYRTNIAYFIYVLLIIVIITAVWRFQLSHVRLKHNAEIEHLQAEKYLELDHLKSNFFANISHEFRTPLTLIRGPAQNIIDNSKEGKILNSANLIYRNADKLNRLVAQLLDLSKIEAGEMKLRTSQIDVIQLLKSLTLSFKSLADSKNIMLKFNSVDEQLHVYLDRDKIEKIINNILSNALKFTEENGEIVVDVFKIEKFVEIKISDTGIGIPKERLTKIYDRFYQVDSSYKREHEGTGIGLALTKELVELHRGEIHVESEEGAGTTFTLRFPLGKDHLKLEEICGDDQKEYDEIDIKHVEEETTVSNLNNKKTRIELLSTNDKPILLIVEDNVDVKNYLKEYFEEEYLLLEAGDGREGLNLSLEYLPDIIVSDVMMPKMDGFELLEKLKMDEKTSHIPVVMLTAKATDKDKIKGLETGADDYLMKPFDAIELKIRIKNLIEQRKRLREHFKKEGLLNFQTEHISSTDKQFLNRIIETIDNNLSDETFGVYNLSQEAAMSRSQLHRKLTALIDASPGDLIRRIRLTKAAKLLKEKFGNISEIALEVGYTNPANFTRSFTKLFGVPPSEYSK